jgi:pimeloyl-ACP methyl ester carboxylesterase
MAWRFAVTTYVLIHGTGSGGWLWDPVATRLRAAGDEVHAPTLIGVGERAGEGGPETDLTTHIQQIVSLVQSLSAPRVVLVGFSYSGLVVGGVAATIPNRIAQLVFIDALLVSREQSGFDAFPPEAVEQFRADARDHGEGWKLPPFPLERVGGIGPVESGVSFADIERTLLERRGTHPIGSYEERVTWDATSLADISRRYVICTGKPSPMRERLTARAQELRESGWAVDELPTGHFPMWSMPNALTALLLRGTTLSADGAEASA